MVDWIPPMPTVGIPRMPTQYGRTAAPTREIVTTIPTPDDGAMADVLTRGVLDIIVVGVIGLILLVFLFLWMRHRTQGGW